VYACFQPSSYVFLSCRVARLALMILIVSPSATCTTTTRWPRCVCPIKMYRSSSSEEWSGSGRVIERASAKAVLASSKDTPCLRRFVVAFLPSHSNLNATWRLQWLGCSMHKPPCEPPMSVVGRTARGCAARLADRRSNHVSEATARRPNHSDDGASAACPCQAAFSLSSSWIALINSSTNRVGVSPM